MGRSELAVKLEMVFRQLLAREDVDLYAADMSLVWEVIASTLIGTLPDRKWCYFDGVINLGAHVRKQRQVEFTGDMWVGKDQRQWTEPFRARVTDKSMTKQGMWVLISVGNDTAEAELRSALGINDNAKDPASNRH